MLRGDVNVPRDYVSRVAPANTSGRQACQIVVWYRKWKSLKHGREDQFAWAVMGDGLDGPAFPVWSVLMGGSVPEKSAEPRWRPT